MAWCAAQCRDADEAVVVASKILDFTRDYPDVAERHTYRKLLDMIERNAREGIGR